MISFIIMILCTFSTGFFIHRIWNSSYPQLYEVVAMTLNFLGALANGYLVAQML